MVKRPSLVGLDESSGNAIGAEGDEDPGTLNNRLERCLAGDLPVGLGLLLLRLPIGLAKPLLSCLSLPLAGVRTAI